MKKLFFYFILMLGLTISCQSGTDDNLNEKPTTNTTANKMTGRSAEGDFTAEQKEEMEIAVSLVKAEQRLVLDGKEPDYSSTNRAIQCHTDYNNTHSGNACVSIKGHLYNVTWTDLVSYGTITEILDEPQYTSTPVRSCRC